MTLESFVAASKAAKCSFAKCLVLFVIALALVVLGHNAANAQDEVVAKFSGDGTANTRPFTVTGPWEIQFNNLTNKYLVIELKNANGDLLGIAASMPRQGTGTSYQPRAGTYFLKVISGGPWAITVARVK